jgi:hypothetical protein
MLWSNTVGSNKVQQANLHRVVARPRHHALHRPSPPRQLRRRVGQGGARAGSGKESTVWVVGLAKL